MTNVCSQSRSVRPQNNDCTWISSSDKQSRPPPPECVVTEQSTTCCCFFYRHICHGDGCHPGRLPGASHPCREDGRPLRARRASQTDVEAGGGGAAAAAGLNAESCRWKRCIRLAAGRPAPVTRVRLGLHCSNWFLTNGKKLCRRTEQQQQRHNLRGCQACDREAWCKSDKDSDTRKQYLHCDVWRLNNTSYFPCGSCSYRSGAAGLTTGFINVFIPSCLQCFASGQSLTHNENISYPAKDIISPTTGLKGPVHNKLRKHFPLFCCAIYESANKEDLNSSVSFQKWWPGYVFFPRQHTEGNMFVMSMNLVTRKENWKQLTTRSVDDL